MILGLCKGTSGLDNEFQRINYGVTFQRDGAVARSEASSLGMQAAPRSIPTSGTFFRGDLVIKTFLRPFFPLPLIQEEQLSVTGEIMCTKYW